MKRKGTDNKREIGVSEIGSKRGGDLERERVRESDKRERERERKK